MNNLKILTKTFFLSGFKVNKKKGNQKSTFHTLALYGILFLVASIFYNFTYTFNAVEYAKENSISILYALKNNLVGFYGVATFLVLMITTTQMEGTIYKAKDYELLESLPIKKSTVVSAKILSVFLMSVVEDAIILVPTCVFYLIFSSDIYGFIISLVFIPFTSLFALTISSILGFVIAFITSRMKHSNIFSIILYLIYFSLVFLFSFSMSSSGYLDGEKYANFLIHLKVFIISFDIKNILYFILLLIGILLIYILSVFIIAKSYRKINELFKNSNSHTIYKKDKNNINFGQDKMLFRKEIKFITSNPQYLINSFLGSVITFIIGIIFILVDMTNGEVQDPSSIKAEMIMIYMAIVMGIIMNGFMTSTSTSFSLEGSCIEGFLSLPINPKKVIKNKLKVGIIIPLPINIIVGIILSTIWTIKYNFDISIILSLVVFPQLSTIFIALVGILCGMRYPKFDFENQQQIYKNSSCVNYTMLFGTLPLVLISILSMTTNILFINFGINPIYSFITTVILYLIYILIAYLILKNKGLSLYKKMLER